VNAELELLEPSLLNTTESPQWLPTSDPNVFAAVMRGNKETVVLPIYFGANTQHCPDQMSLNSLSITVPLVPDGAVGWRVSPAGLDDIKDIKRNSEGAVLTIPEFDMTAAIILSTDAGCTGRIVKLQEATRNRFRHWAAYNARRQAYIQYQKTAELHKLLCAAGAPPVREAMNYFLKAQGQLEEASRMTDNNQPEFAFHAARRALRPLRVLMHEHWRGAAEQLDSPIASPFAVSVYSLPQHWELARYMATCQPAGTLLSNGSFDLAGSAEAGGAAVASLPGWIARKQFVDAVKGRASLVNSDTEFVQDPPLPEYICLPDRYEASGRPVPNFASKKSCQPRPDLGSHVLQLKMDPKTKNPDEVPKALERSFIAVDSPVVDFAPGSWVRISFWIKVPGTAATADGAMVYDSVGGEALALRLNSQPEWKHFNLYRPIPASGKIQVTCALTGLGIMFVDDLRIEPMLPSNAPRNAVDALPMLGAVRAVPKPLPKADDDRPLPQPRRLGETEKSEPLPQPRTAPREPTSLPLQRLPDLPRVQPISTRK